MTTVRASPFHNTHQKGGNAMPKQSLDQQYVDNLSPVPDGKKSIEHNDTSIPGFHIRQNAGSTVGTWVYSYKNAAGKRSHVNLGRTDVMPFEEARALAVDKRLEVLAGRDPAYERLQAMQVMTVDEFYTQQYLPYAKQHLRSWSRYDLYYRTRLKARFGNLPLNKVPLADMQQLHSELAAEGLKPATCDHYAKFMRVLLNKAVKFGLIKTNPLTRIELFNADNKQQRFLQKDEMERLMTQLGTDPNREVACLITFLIATGARRGEAFQVRWQDIDLSVPQWHIPATSAKAKVGRYVPLNALAVAVLQECETRRATHRSDYVFESPRSRSAFTDVQHQWLRILRDAKVKRCRLHDLRHTFASLLVNGGTSLYAVSKLLGHADVQVSQRYAHLTQETLREESARLGRALLASLPSAEKRPALTTIADDEVAA
jgi:integrase